MALAAISGEAPLSVLKPQAVRSSRQGAHSAGLSGTFATARGTGNLKLAGRVWLQAGLLVPLARRRRRTRGLRTASAASSAPVAGKYDGPALDAYYGKNPLRAVSRLVEVVSRINAARTAWQDEAQPQQQRGQRLRDEVSSLGTVFVKLAQTMATRSDLVTKELGRELRVLQDSMGRFPDEVALETIREEFEWTGPVAARRPGPEGHEASKDGEPLFASLSAEPVAAASLAQVYRGNLLDGREVAVKVQRPGLADQVGLDFYVLRQMLSAVNAVMGATRSSEIAESVLSEVADGLFAEIDFTMEGQHIEKFMDLYGADCPDVVVPEVIWSRTRLKVLTTTWLLGRKPRDLNAQEKLRMVNLAAPCLSLQLMGAGFVHCDPHEGNMMLLEDGRLGLIDFGLVAQMTDVHQESMASAILSLLAEDYRALVPCFRGMGILSSQRDDDEDLKRPGETQPFAEALEEALTGGGGGRLVQESAGLDRRRAFGQLYEELSNLAFRYYFTLPSYYILVMRSFVTLEGIAFGADPDFNMYTTSSPYAFRRLLTPRTPEGKKLLEQTILEPVKDGAGRKLRLLTLLQGSLISGKSRAQQASAKEAARLATKTVAEVLLAAEGEELREILASLDSTELVEDLASKGAAPFRRAALSAALGRMRPTSDRQHRRQLRRMMRRHLSRAAQRRPLLVAKLLLQLLRALLP
ncbi:unnamed protein product [Effrenium voratum]|uniref:ABC1 atypical kinase-like domain-containing protein n=1 Tax=Effrenium voratum TaxID=2562239 RepID=A0AA36JK77_9DINO|nr:unnamed protein product [Effrenium voratum]